MDKDTFIKLVQDIDSKFSNDEVPIFQRPLRNFIEITKRVDPKKQWRMLNLEDVAADDFSDDALCAQVHRWYESLYGDKIKTSLGPGKYFILIRGEPWEVTFPGLAGSHQFTIDPELNWENGNIIRTKKDSVVPINVFKYFKGMPIGLAKSLSISELNEILDDFMFGLNAVQSLRDARRLPYMTEASNDYDVAVSNLFSKFPNYGNIKWSSLQFTEKTIKSKLELNSIKFPKNHKLNELASLLNTINISISSNLIDNVQCPAGVRYGEIKVGKSEAILSLKSALYIFDSVFKIESFANIC